MADLKNIDWRKMVSTMAPAIATAFGTPVLGMAVGALSNAIFGNPNASEEEIGAAITSGQLTGEQIAAIKQADLAFKTRMRELDIDLEKLQADTEKSYLLDVQDARARQVSTGDWMPQIILGVAFLVYVVQFFVIVQGLLPADEFARALIVRAFGTVDGIVITGVAFFVGSSRGSKRSGDAVRNIAESQAAAQATK